ncbi:hypothetical protein IGL19_002430 [Enterococcus sp. DIV2387]|uniref:hypothetical protein n=1 Tax=Enterococcus faecalis TaxID=1351 RepID=UPI000E14912B|nr:hypothetical protein [Enterococcus faecalis]RBR87779.1 hypothetical protein EB58_02677 [Enterococcus faecalis]HBI3769474.1 hypothetical protein [Enterococcus faecalis]
MKNKKFSPLTIICVIIGLCCWIVSIVGIGYFISHPELIGHWFSRLISGFK